MVGFIACAEHVCCAASFSSITYYYFYYSGTLYDHCVGRESRTGACKVQQSTETCRGLVVCQQHPCHVAKFLQEHPRT